MHRAHMQIWAQQALRVQASADALGIDRDWLYYLAGRFPEDVRNKKLSEKQVAEAMVAFRSSPRKGKGRS